MSGISRGSRSRVGQWLLLFGVLIAQRDRPLSATMTPVKRDDMIAFVKAMAEHQWVMGATNLAAPCIKNYRSRFPQDQHVTGVAYDWGGMDDIAEFDRKLAAGLAAGSHQDQGVSACTTGVDCSGLVSLAWRQPSKFGTSALHEIADPLTGDKLTVLKKGDALNRAGVHVVIFDSYNADGTINVYEASGSQSRVVFNRNQDWSRFSVRGKEYLPIRYKATLD